MTRAKSNSGFERYTLYEVSAILGIPMGNLQKMLASLPRSAGMRPIREPRGLTYDADAVERILRAKKIPTRTPPGQPTWLDEYQEGETHEPRRLPRPPSSPSSSS